MRGILFRCIDRQDLFHAVLSYQNNNETYPLLRVRQRVLLKEEDLLSKVLLLLILRSVAAGGACFLKIYSGVAQW